MDRKFSRNLSVIDSAPRESNGDQDSFSSSSTDQDPKRRINPNYLIESSTYSRDSRQPNQLKQPVRYNYDFSDSDSMSFEGDSKDPHPNM